MKLLSRYYGEREYEEKDIITFEKGLPGFRELKKFIIFPVEENKVFNMLHSIDNMEIGLVIVSPFYVMKEYEFELSDEKIDELSVEKENDINVYTTVCLNKDIKNITVNLKAPIVINIKENKGEQLILDDDKYQIKYPLFKEE